MPRAIHQLCVLLPAWLTTQKVRSSQEPSPQEERWASTEPGPVPYPEGRGSKGHLPYERRSMPLMQGGSEQPPEKAQTGQGPLQQGHQTRGCLPPSPFSADLEDLGAPAGPLHKLRPDVPLRCCPPHSGRREKGPPCPRPVLWGQLCGSMVRPQPTGGNLALPRPSGGRIWGGTIRPLPSACTCSVSQRELEV